MVSAKTITQTLDILDSVESYTLQTSLETLCLAKDLKVCKEESPNKPPFAINFLEYYDSHEPVTSWIIRHIFAYTYNGKHPFFESFAKRFLIDIGFNIDWIKAPIINKDHEHKGIDVLVREKQYALIIENKLKGADFQLNQLARYIATMRFEGYSDDQIFVVVLPRNDISNDDLCDSVWNLPKDWQSTNQSRKCRLDNNTCWCDYDDISGNRHCEKCEQLRDAFKERTLFIHKDLSNWLYDSIINNKIGVPEKEIRKQYVLISAALQFVDFLNYLYETRENDKFKMDIQNFLSKQLNLNDINIIDQLSVVVNKQNDVAELSSHLDSLYLNKVGEFISEEGKKYKVHIVRDEGEDYNFHCNLKLDGKTIILSLGWENEYFCQIETNNRRRLPQTILDDFEISEELNDPNNSSDCIWKYDNHLQSLLRFDRVLSRLFVLQNEI